MYREGIRLEFGRLMGFSVKSCSLLAASIAYKVLKYNDINYRISWKSSDDNIINNRGKIHYNLDDS